MRLFSRFRIDQDIDEELRSHVELRANDLVKSGLDRAAAERQARIEFGGHLRFKEASREAAGIAMLDIVAQDLHFSARMLRKSPAFAITAIVTLALGIGANAVVFSVLNALILRPLNVPQPETLYQLERGKDRIGSQSYPDYLDVRDRNRTFEALAGYDLAVAGLDAGDNPTRVWVVLATGNYFDALRIQPSLGRLFHAPDEHGPNSAPFVVLSHAFWHSHFQDDPAIVGRVVQLNNRPYTIIGVAPPGFRGTLLFGSAELFVPIVNQEQIEGASQLHLRGSHSMFQVIGHLKDGVTPAQALSDLNAIGADLEKTYPNEDSRMTFSLARPGLYGDYLGPVVQAFVMGLMLLAGLILLAACANVGSLFAARAADRSREVALKLALGASGARVVRQLFTEALLVAIAGGAVGVAASLVVVRGLEVWQPFSRFPINVPVAPDATVYAVSALVTIASGFLFGALPAGQALRASPYEIVKAGAARTGRSRVASRDLLLVVQIAICGVLVTASVVAVRGLIRSMHAHFGFEPDHVLLIETDLSMSAYREDTAPPMQKRLIEATATIPGAQSVGMIDQLPLSGPRSTMPIYDDGTSELRPADVMAEPLVYRVSPDYFKAAGTALLSGRLLNTHDDNLTPRVAVVNQEFARRIFGSVERAVGRHFKVRPEQSGDQTGVITRIQVVGVVEDGKYVHVVERPMPAMFFPFEQSPSTSTWLVLRSNREPRELAIEARDVLRTVDPGLPVFIETWNSELNSGVAQFGPRMAAASLGVLGAMSGMLSVTGIFGLAAYSVSRRTRELGIRVALGAQKRAVLQAALGRVIKVVAIGSVVGLVVGVLASRLLAVMVYQASPRDPIVLAGAVMAMAILGLLGAWIPAQRALDVDPLILLHEE